MSPLGILAALFMLLAIYCAVDPLGHSAISEFPDFEAVRVDMPPWNSRPVETDSENSLQRSDVGLLKEVQGPESIAFDGRGRGPYTGVADGRVVFWNGRDWTDFAYTSANRSGLCDPKPSILGYMKNEHICGRPLGLRFDKKTGDLYIADAYFGLMKVGPEGGLATSITNEAEGVPLGFTNDLDIDDEGNIYFTDSSTKYRRRNFLQLVFSSEGSGRVLKYDPRTKETTVLVRNVQFPNGLSLSKDGSFFVVCEGQMGRLSRYWLKGEKAGTWEPLAVLHGFADNVRTNKEGDFWVAIHCRRNIYTHVLALYPKVRHALLKLPISAKFHFFMQVGGRLHAIVVKYSPEGKLLQILLKLQPEFSGSEGSRSILEDGAIGVGSYVFTVAAL